MLSNMAASAPRWHGIGPARWLGWVLALALLWPMSRFVWRLRVRGAETLPRDRPYLLLPNHTSLMDPVWVALHLGRPTHFMTSAQLFRYPWVAALIRFFGAFPKMKYVKDRESMATVAALYDAGHTITIFAEGQRTWDGRLLHIGDGLGRLIKRLDAEVVFARVTGGHIHQPRWTTRMRWVPIDIVYEGPHRYPESLSAAEITADVGKRLAIEPHPELKGLTWGRRLAEGLPFFLFGCPACGQLRALAVSADGDGVGCSACDAAWRMDLRNVLRGTHGQADLPLTEASDLLQAHLGSPPVANRDRYEADGTVLSGPQASVGRLERGADPVPVAEGPIRLDTRSLHVGDWSLPLTEIVATSLQVAGIYQVRTTDALFQLSPGQDSTYMWSCFLEAWRSSSAVALRRPPGCPPDPGTRSQPDPTDADSGDGAPRPHGGEPG